MEACFDAPHRGGRRSRRPPASEWRDEGRSRLVRTNDPGECVAGLVRWSDARGLRLADTTMCRASLEDAFIALTGRILPIDLAAMRKTTLAHDPTLSVGCSAGELKAFSEAAGKRRPSPGR